MSLQADYYLLVSSNRNYELDAFLEAFAACSEMSIKAELFAIIGEGRVLIALFCHEHIDIRRSIDQINARRNTMKYVKKAKIYSLVAKKDEMRDVIESLRSELISLARDAKIAISVDGIGLTASFGKDLICKILEGVQAQVDLENPNILVELFFFGDYFLIEPALPLSVPNVEHSRGFNEKI